MTDDMMALVNALLGQLLRLWAEWQPYSAMIAAALGAAVLLLLLTVWLVQRRRARRRRAAGIATPKVAPKVTPAPAPSAPPAAVAVLVAPSATQPANVVTLQPPRIVGVVGTVRPPQSQPPTPTPAVAPSVAPAATRAVAARAAASAMAVAPAMAVATMKNLFRPPATMPAVGTLDPEFLPAALELVVTPASPVATATAMTICGAVTIALVWSYFSWIDIHAIAIGKIQPSGRSKVVQPLETGRVTAVRVDNGSVVAEGAELIELDATDTGADRTALAREHEAASGETSRRRAAIAAARTEYKIAGAIAFDANIGPDVRRREADVLEADLAQLRSALASLRSQRAEKQATVQKLTMGIDARKRLLALYKERVDMRETLEKSGAGSRALTVESLQQYEAQLAADVGDRGQLLETEAALASLTHKRDEIVTQFVADQSQKLAEAEKKRDRAEQDLVKAQSRRDRTVLRAPIAGVVQQLAVSTIGQVVSAGQSVLTVVPLDVPIEVEALINNADIGFVTAGQPAVVKVEAFPYTRYGTIDATVAKVSSDAVDQRAAAAGTDASAAARPQTGTPNTTAMDNLVFPATIMLARRTILVDEKEIPLKPGMSVTVEIKTGARRALDYILSPLRELSTGTAHER